MQPQSELQLTCAQMWVEKDEWQENPDIIHTKFA